MLRLITTLQAQLCLGQQLWGRIMHTDVKTLCRPEEAKTQPQWDAAKISPDGTSVQDVVEPHQIFFTPNKKVRLLQHASRSRERRRRLYPVVDTYRVMCEHGTTACMSDSFGMSDWCTFVSLQVTELYETVMDQDFRLALQRIQPGTVLWELSGKRTSDEAEEPVHIGQVVLTSKIVASSYCDDTLFFQHMRHRRPENGGGFRLCAIQ